MKKFERLVMVDNTGTVEFVKESLAELAPVDWFSSVGWASSHTDKNWSQ